MKYLPELTFLTPLFMLALVGILLAAEIESEPIIIEQPRCEIKYIPITNSIGFKYDECNGLVKHQYDTTWTELGMFEIRRIKMEKTYEQQN